MNTRRKLIRIVPASAAMIALSACGKKEEVPATPAPAAAAPAPAPAAPAATTAAPAAATSPTAAATPAAPASAAGAMVDEKDAQASALGYVADAGKVDKAKFATYQAGSACSNCALYQGAAGSEAGGCGIFAGKQVSAKGWCSAYSKKA